MKSISYTSLIVSITLLYWWTAIAYNRVIIVDSLDVIPVFYKQKCVVMHLNSEQDKNIIDDLNIYYSGTRVVDNLSDQKLISQESKIQEEILKVVKEKQITQSLVVEKTQPQTITEIKTPEKTIQKNIVRPKDDRKKQPKIADDDAFSMKKKSDNSYKNQPKKNVFDVIE